MAEPHGPDRTSERHLDEQLLLDLLHGMATAPAARAMLDHARTCTECEEKLRVRAAEVETLRAEPVPVVAQPATPRRARWYLPLVATAAAAMILAVIWTQREQPAALEPFWIPSGRELIVQRGGEDGPSLEPLAQGIRAYEARELQRAIPLLEQAPSRAELDALRRIYLASAYLVSQRPAAAVATLERLELRELPQPWQDEARWILYLAWIDQGEPAAGELLDSLATRPGAIGDRARAAQRVR